jgi:hypothetical protein
MLQHADSHRPRPSLFHTPSPPSPYFIPLHTCTPMSSVPPANRVTEYDTLGGIGGNPCMAMSGRTGRTCCTCGVCCTCCKPERRRGAPLAWCPAVNASLRANRPDRVRHDSGEPCSLHSLDASPPPPPKSLRIFIFLFLHIFTDIS